MESELSGIFRVKLVTKNIVRGSPGTQFMHMRVKQGIKELRVFTVLTLNEELKMQPIVYNFLLQNLKIGMTSNEQRTYQHIFIEENSSL